MARLTHSDLEKVLAVVQCVSRARSPDEFSRAAVSELARLVPSDVLALPLKPSDDDAWMTSLFGASGQRRNMKLNWCTPAPHSLWLSDLSEKTLDQEVLSQVGV